MKSAFLLRVALVLGIRFIHGRTETRRRNTEGERAKETERGGRKGDRQVWTERERERERCRRREITASSGEVQ